MVTNEALHPQVKEFLQQPHRNFIGGEWVGASSSASIEVINPATEDVIAEVGAGTLDDVDRAVAAARKALKGPWSSISSAERGRLIYRYADLLEQHADELAQIETLENGMPLRVSSYMAHGIVVDTFRYYAGWPTKIEGSVIPATLPRQGDSEFLVISIREPVGVVVAITPWNAPSAMLTIKLPAILAAGCTAIIKPASLTPLLAERYVQLADEAGFPPGVVNLIQGRGAEVGTALAGHDGVDKVAFTGSTEVGREIVKAASGNLKKVTLELGGKSPFVVFPDANLEEAIPEAARACFFLSGQNCMAGTRLFLHEDIHDEFVEKLVETTAQMKVGDGFDPDTVLGPLISKGQRETVLSYIESGKAEGAEMVVGGKTLDRPGYFLEPTIFINTERDMKIVREEIFGPVLSVQKFGDDWDDLEARVGDTIYGLSGSVWTRDLTTAIRGAKFIDSGQVGVNFHAAISPETPFGGNRQSGWGREFGKEGLDAFLKSKSISIKH